MSTAACLSVDTFDIDDTERVSWDDTSLVKRKTVFTLSFGLIHKTFRDIVTIIDQSVGSILNFLLLLASETLIVCDIKMSLLLGLLCTSLPNMGSKDLAARSENEMCSGMMSLKLETSFSIYGSIDSFANGVEVFGNLSVKLVKYAFTDFNAINNVKDLVDAIDAKCTNVIGLSSGSWVEATLIEDHQVPFVLFLDVCENSDAFSSEIHRAIIVKVDTSRLGQMNRIV